MRPIVLKYRSRFSLFFALLLFFLCTGFPGAQDTEDEGPATEAETRISSTGEKIRRRLYLPPIESETIPAERQRAFFELLKVWVAGNTDVELTEIARQADCRLILSGELLEGTSPEERSYRLSWRTEDLAFPDRPEVSGSREFRNMTTAAYYAELFPVLGAVIEEAFPRAEQKLIEVIRKKIVEEVVVRRRVKDGVRVTLTAEPGTRIWYDGETYTVDDSGKLYLEAPPNAEMKIRAALPGRLSGNFSFFVHREALEREIVLRRGARWGLEIRHRIPDMAPSPGVLYFLVPGNLFLEAYVEQNFFSYVYDLGDTASYQDEYDAPLWTHPDEVSVMDNWTGVYQPGFLQPFIGLGGYVWGEPDAFFRSALHGGIFTRFVFEEGRDYPAALSELVTAGFQLGWSFEFSPFERWRLVFDYTPRMIYSLTAQDGPMTDYVKMSDYTAPEWIGAGWHLQYKGSWSLCLRVLL